jgi:hypothetical protein
MFITYKKEKLPLVLNYVAVSKFQKETGKTLSDIQDDINLLEDLAYHGLLEGARLEGNTFFKIFKLKSFKYNRSEMTYIMNECFEQFIQTINESLPEKPKDTEGEKKK